jgi:hypothetical protein
MITMKLKLNQINFYKIKWKLLNYKKLIKIPI